VVVVTILTVYIEGPNIDSLKEHVAAAAGGAISVPTKKVDAAICMNLYQYDGGGDRAHCLYKGPNIGNVVGDNSLRITRGSSSEGRWRHLCPYEQS
jgi:hypothetical protein